MKNGAIVATLLLLTLIAALVTIHFKGHAKHHLSHGKCKAHAHTCGAIDPVSDPDYNMREIVKQSILLEEHLAEKKKRCKDCICKHFYHIIGLSEEAQCLAGSKVSKYPLMDSNPEFYERLFQRWLSNREDDATQLHIQDELRGRRKQLVEIYVLGDGAK